MFITRLSKALMVLPIALSASLVVFGNITDCRTSLAFVQHVLATDAIVPDVTIRYRLDLPRSANKERAGP